MSYLNTKQVMLAGVAMGAVQKCAGAEDEQQAIGIINKIVKDNEKLLPDNPVSVDDFKSGIFKLLQAIKLNGR